MAVPVNPASSYICALPLEKCLTLLQAKSDQILDFKESFIFPRRLRVKLTFENSDKYFYSLEVPFGKGYLRLMGYLSRIDSQHTEIAIQSEFSFRNWIILGSLFILFSILLIWEKPYLPPLLVGFGLFIIFVFGKIEGNRVKQKLLEILLAALPPSKENITGEEFPRP